MEKKEQKKRRKRRAQMTTFDTAVQLLGGLEWAILILLLFLCVVVLILFVCIFRMDAMPPAMRFALGPILGLDAVAHCVR